MSLKLLPCSHPPSPSPHSPHSPHSPLHQRRYGPYLRPSDSYPQLAALISLAASGSSPPSQQRPMSTTAQSPTSRHPPSSLSRRPTHLRTPSSSRLRLPTPLPAPRIPPTLVNSPFLTSSGSAFRQHHTMQEMTRAREAAERDEWDIRDWVPQTATAPGSAGRPELPLRAKSDTYALPPPRARPSLAQPLYTPQPSSSAGAFPPPQAGPAPPSTPAPRASQRHAQPPGYTRAGSTTASHSRLGPDSPAAAGAEEEMREYFQSIGAPSGPEGDGTRAGGQGKERKG